MAVNGRRGRWLAMALFASLLVNVFLVSVLVAKLLLPAEPTGKQDRYSYIGQWHAMAESLPAPQREVALAKWKEQEAVWDRSRTERSAARQALSAALLTEPLDEAALRAAFAQMRATSNLRWTAFQAAVLETAPHLPLEQRKAYVEASIKRWAQRDAARAGKK